jgi:hypothetical protein
MGAHISKKTLAVAVPVALGAVVVVGCGELRAERQGVQAGRAICDVKQADSVEEAEREITQAQRQLQDLERIVGRPISEDLDDIDENFTDMLEHVRQGNEALLEQDIAAIQRNIRAVASTLTGKGEAAYDGVQEGLAECDYS